MIGELEYELQRRGWDYDYLLDGGIHFYLGNEEKFIRYEAEAEEVLYELDLYW